MTAAMALILGSACGAGEISLDVFASDEDGRPLSGLEVTVLPHDHVRLLDSLGTAALTPRPTFEHLEREFQGYRMPDVEALHSADGEWRAIRDSVRHLSDSLNVVGRDAPGYARRYQYLGDLYRRFTQLTAERDARLRDQIGAHRDLAEAAQAAADSLRLWEQVAYADYRALAESASIGTGREGLTAVTGPDGIATVSLEPGPWWVTARLRDPENPYREYFWNIGLVAGRFGPRRVPLALEFAERRWRH